MASLGYPDHAVRATHDPSTWLTRSGTGLTSGLVLGVLDSHVLGAVITSRDLCRGVFGCWWL